jgi:hypothetical protein
MPLTERVNGEIQSTDLDLLISAHKRSSVVNSSAAFRVSLDRQAGRERVCQNAVYVFTCTREGEETQDEGAS